MKQLFFICLLFSVITRTFGQIDMNDSTAQVIGYWAKNEKQLYLVTHESFKVKGTDTTSKESYEYALDITIVDSTADSYIIDWFYHDLKMQTDNELIKKLSSLAQDMTIRIKTNELGVFKEVVNWKEIRDYIYKGTTVLKEETRDIPNLDKVIKQLEGMYSTKESIEAAAIKEIIQFYAFHGGKYKLGEEISTNMKAANLYGGEPFDMEVVFWLDEINPGEDNSIIKMQQVINSEQLTKTTFDYLTKMAEPMKIPGPKWEEFPPFKNETWIASQIHGSGWIVYSIGTKEISSEGILKVEKSIIELQ